MAKIRLFGLGLLISLSVAAGPLHEGAEDEPVPLWSPPNFHNHADHGWPPYDPGPPKLSGMVFMEDHCGRIIAASDYAYLIPKGDRTPDRSDF